MAFEKLKTPKFHWLTAHLVPFVKQHRFWGLFSEQPIESLHARTNRDFSRYRNVKNEDRLLQYIAGACSLRNAIFDTKKSKKIREIKKINCTGKRWHGRRWMSDM